MDLYLTVKIIITIVIFFIIIFFLTPLRYRESSYRMKLPKEFGYSEEISPEISTIIDMIWKKLPKGHIIYNPPSEMQIGVEERIEARIANRVSENLNRGLKGRGAPQSEEIKVSSRMSVHLDGGDAFNIKQLFTNEDQAIVGDYAQWEWDVVPLKSGIQKLNLCVDAIIETPNLSDRTYHVHVFERTINVRVNYAFQARSFFVRNWQFIITTLIAVAVAIIALLAYWAKQ